MVARRAVRLFENCPNRVCVDHNFLNWYRTQAARRHWGRTWVIPNFAPIPTDKEVEARPHRNGDARIAPALQHSAGLLGSADRDPRRRNRVELERLRESVKLITAFHDRRGIADSNYAEVDHRLYLITTQDASSCDLPNR